MKSIKVLMKVAFLAVSLFVIASCGDGHSHNAEGGHDATEATTAVVHGEGQAYNAAYVCPMHCEGSGAAAAGKCPVCGMDYVSSAEHVKDGHQHANPNEGHEGHNHDNHEGHNHD